MRRAVVALTTTVLLAAGLMSTAPTSAAVPAFDHLDPGGQPDLRERLPVNVVFVGYNRRQVRTGEFVDGLARRYQPIVRSRAFYGIEEKLGITYRYDYRLRFTGRRYEGRFFRTLKRLSRPAPLTMYQQQYNDQADNVLDVRSNSYIDAPSVERWLAANAPRGVNTRRNTIYLINWYHRRDFEFHVYTKTNEPDPDTGYNFGAQRDSRKIVAWGGTTAADEENGLGSTRRVWFHDISAGPESWGGSWNVDDGDLDGDGVADYRIPTAWEYGPGAYRPRSALTGDLAKLTRYVGLDLLFTTSPLYPAELPTDEPPETINVDNNTYEGWPGTNASREYVTRPLLMAELGELLHRDQLSYDNQDLRYAGDARRCYLLLLEDESCYPRLGYPPFANLFLQNTFQLKRTQDDRGRVDYELPIFSYAVDAGVGAPALGFADDNYRDGTQTYVFAFVSPEIVESGYGLTTTMIHEVGHHVALSHPHDGYDSSSGVDFEPTGDFFFAWAGDEANSMMSYIDLNWDFSQFDLDNMDRFQAAALIEATNRLAGQALAADDAPRAYDELRRADRLVGRSEAAFAGHHYRWALRLAGRAYDQALEGAGEAGVDIEQAQLRALVADRAARQASAVHQPGEFIDTLDPDGPRSQP
ncbi:MAG TPA: hypothetical protein VFJ14_14485 [Nocardioidaceae bacterium]|nr:hypothetical protein [Nocardioidaceae bacterium]